MRYYKIHIIFNDMKDRHFVFSAMLIVASLRKIKNQRRQNHVSRNKIGRIEARFAKD